MLQDLLKSVDLGTYYSFHEFGQSSPFLHDLMQLGDWAGAFGSEVLLLIALGLLLARNRPRVTLIALGTFVAAFAMAELLRTFVPAQRPLVVADTVGDAEMLRSFPARGVLTFTVAAVLLTFAAWTALRRWQLRWLLAAILAVLVLWVAMSQLLLDLHYVTDVAAGLFGGLALGVLASRLAGGGSIAAPRAVTA